MTDDDLDDCPEPWRSEINRLYDQRRELEADNERLRAALRDIVDREADASGGARLADFHDIGCACGRCAADIACAALEEK